MKDRDLDAEESTNWTVGLVWNPLDDLTVILDWFDIELENSVSRPAAQVLLDQELALRNAGVEPVPADTPAGRGLRVGRVVRDPRNDRIVATVQTDNNIGKTETDGLDVEGSYAIGLGWVGDFQTTVQWTWVNEYELDEAGGEPVEAERQRPARATDLGRREEHPARCRRPPFLGVSTRVRIDTVISEERAMPCRTRPAVNVAPKASCRLSVARMADRSSRTAR